MRRPSVPHAQFADLDAQEFANSVRVRSEMDDGAHDPQEERVTIRRMREILVAAGVSGAENIEP